MTQTDLYNIIDKTCPLIESQRIIDYCNQQEYNQARIIIDDLQDEERYQMDQHFLDDDVIFFNDALSKINEYQLIWNELVHQLEQQNGN